MLAHKYVAHPKEDREYCLGMHAYSFLEKIALALACGWKERELTIGWLE